MKYMFSVDIEGISGVVSWNQADMDCKEYEHARELMNKETDAAIKGAFEGGAEEVLVVDGHANMRNLLLEELDKRVEVIIGTPRVKCMMEGLDKDVAGVGFVGYHSSASSYGTLAHTYSGSVVDRIYVGDKMASEFALNSYLAAQYGVPVFFISGDQETVKEAQELYPDIPHVITKYATGRYSARCIHPKTVRTRIREVVKQAIEENSSMMIKPDDTCIRAWFTDPGKLDNVELLPEVDRVGPKEFIIDTGDFEKNYKLFRACTMLAKA